MGKVMIAGRRSKTVAFLAILALATLRALATASAQPADIKAIDKAFQESLRARKLLCRPDRCTEA
jgi:hypothetical protein